ncbi:MAG: cell division protein FtsZ [Thermodesulfobacteriota bacterium]
MRRQGGDAMLEFEENRVQPARIKVLGIGGGGCNAVDNMIRSELRGVEFIAANTDVQALKASMSPVKIQLGARLTKGLGAGANPEVGKSAALEDIQRIKESILDTDMLFIAAGMGGGTGTGGAPVVAKLAREMGVLTVAVVTKPFFFEGRRRSAQAEQGIQELEDVVDTLITIPNDRLLSVSGKDTKLQEAFRMADDVLLQAVKGITDIITVHGIINVDFADVMTVMSGMGKALMGTGSATGESRGTQAAQAAVCSPLLEDVSIEGATGILINVTGSSKSLTLDQVKDAVALVQKEAHDEANIIFGAVIDDELGEELRATVIATGFRKAAQREERPQPLKAVVGGTRTPRRDLDVPTFRRAQLQNVAAPKRREKVELEYLEIPTFLRKQAD